MNEIETPESDVEYDKRQLVLMIKKIDSFEKGQLYFVYLTGDLRALLEALKIQDEKWNSSFFTFWFDLEQVFAFACIEERLQLDTSDKQIIEKALASLKNLINEKLVKYSA